MQIKHFEKKTAVLLRSGLLTFAKPIFSLENGGDSGS